MKRALLIGAGFSYDLGMPLAADFSATFFNYLSPARCRQMAALMKTQQPFSKDRPTDPKAIDEAFSILEQYRGKDYESFLSRIETEEWAYHGSQAINDSYHYVYANLYDLVYQLLYIYQASTFQTIYRKNFELYRGLENFLSDSETWVFSLNHDLVVEFLAADLSIPLTYGDTDTLSFPVHNLELGRQIAFTCTNVEDYSLAKMKFFKGSRGINLLKLHGGLSEFLYDDKKVRLNTTLGSGTSETILKAFEGVVREMGFFFQGNRFGGIKDKIIANKRGELDVIQAAMLAGGHKYNATLKLKPGEEKLGIFEAVLADLQELVVIGYSFRDQHINLRLYNALYSNKSLRVWVVNPHSTKVPDALAPFDYDMRVRAAMSPTPEWLDYVREQKWDESLMQRAKEARQERSKYQFPSIAECNRLLGV